MIAIAVCTLSSSNGAPAFSGMSRIEVVAFVWWIRRWLTALLLAISLWIALILRRLPEKVVDFLRDVPAKDHIGFELFGRQELIRRRILWELIPGRLQFGHIDRFVTSDR